MVYAYHSTLAPSKVGSLLVRIAVAEHSVYTLLSLLTSGLIGSSVDQTRFFEGCTTCYESGIMLSVPQDVQGLIAYVGLFSVLNGLQFDYKDVYLADIRDRGVDSNDKDCVGWFMYFRLGDNELDILDREVTSEKSIVGDVQVKNESGLCPSGSRWDRGRGIRKRCMP